MKNNIPYSLIKVLRITITIAFCFISQIIARLLFLFTSPYMDYLSIFESEINNALFKQSILYVVTALILYFLLQQVRNFFDPIFNPNFEKLSNQIKKPSLYQVAVDPLKRVFENDEKPLYSLKSLANYFWKISVYLCFLASFILFNTFFGFLLFSFCALIFLQYNLQPLGNYLVIDICRIFFVYFVYAPVNLYLMAQIEYTRNIMINIIGQDNFKLYIGENYGAKILGFLGFLGAASAGLTVNAAISNELKIKNANEFLIMANEQGLSEETKEDIVKRIFAEPTTIADVGLAALRIPFGYPTPSTPPSSNVYQYLASKNINPNPLPVDGSIKSGTPNSVNNAPITPNSGNNAPITPKSGNYAPITPNSGNNDFFNAKKAQVSIEDYKKITKMEPSNYTNNDDITPKSGLIFIANLGVLKTLWVSLSSFINRWCTTTSHKDIGILYSTRTLVFYI